MRIIKPPRAKIIPITWIAFLLVLILNHGVGLGIFQPASTPVSEFRAFRENEKLEKKLSAVDQVLYHAASSISASQLKELPTASLGRYNLAASEFDNDPGARRYAEQLYTGQPDVIQGVYVADGFALPVIQQPERKDSYVSNKLGLVTQFRQAANNGVTGLLAHNYLSGKEFYTLQVGQVVWIIYGNREITPYRITGIQRYQKLEPADASSDYLDLSNQKVLTTAELFNRYYQGQHHLTLQTCLERNDRLDWGLIFIVGRAIESPNVQ